MFCPKFAATTLDNDIRQSAAKVALWDNQLKSKQNQYSTIMKKKMLTKYGCTNGVNEKEGVRCR